MLHYRLRTLLILLAVGPPMLWGAYIVFRPPGRLLLLASFLVAILACVPYAIIRLKSIRLR
jgi:hypothetical protein